MVLSLPTIPFRLQRRSRLAALTSLVALAALGLLGCEDNYYSNTYVSAAGGAGGGSGGGTGDGGVGGGAGGAAEDPYPGAPVADTKVADFSIDLFATPGHRFWFAVSEEQRTVMNGGDGGGGFIPGGEDLYSPGDGGVTTFVDHLWVSTAGKESKTADFGKVETKLAGQSTRRNWTPTTIPNLNIDTDQFTKKQKLQGYEHLRFNNAQVGSIFRERLTLEIMNRLHYPAPLTNYVWVSSNVWGEKVKIPYVLVERYKPHFCKRWEKELGGGCPNMWEFVGDFAGGGGGGGIPMPLGERDAAPPDFREGAGGVVASPFDDPNNCQFSKCDATRVKELEQKVVDTPKGDGFQVALADYIDWPSFHRFQCLSWMLVIGDDALHNGNNVVLVERGDGRFQYLPYSVDISLGQSWYPTVPLPGTNTIASGCQSEASCWAETIATCEDEIAAFKKLDPVKLLDSVYAQLEAEGMLRDGDEARYGSLRSWLETRVDSLADELETFRVLPPPLVCPDGEVDCGDGTCSVAGSCGAVCAPPDKPVDGLPPCPVVDQPVPL